MEITLKDLKDLIKSLKTGEVLRVEIAFEDEGKEEPDGGKDTLYQGSSCEAEGGKKALQH